MLPDVIKPRSWLAAVALLALAPAAWAGGGWTSVVPPASVRGMDGQSHAPSCSGFPATDAAFKFWARKTPSKNLVVYFEGGGACWDGFSCSFPMAGASLPPQVPQLFMPQVPPAADQALNDGIFRDNDPGNPVRDWNMVYIPYCTGDLHAGAATKTYTSVGNPALGLPAGTPLTIQHHGFANFMAVMDWVRKNFDSPKNILVTGSSAGGYGASINFPWVARAYPQAHLYVLADASQGVTTEAWDVAGRSSWNLQLPAFAFGANGSALPSKDLLRAAAVSHPKVKVAQFTTQLDTVQVGFYGLMKQFYGPGGSCPNAAIDWNEKMVGAMRSYTSELDNFRSYLAAGTYHTNLRSPLFYSEASTGVAYNHWVGSMLANRGGARGYGGGDWQDLACPGCLNPLPCP